MFAKSPKSTAPPPAPAPDPLIAFSSSGPLRARLAELEAHKASLLAERLRLERAGVRPEELAGKHNRRKAALSLLTDGDAPIASLTSIDEVGRKLALLARVMDDIGHALELGERRLIALEAHEAAARLEANRPRYDAAMRKIALAVIALEQAQAERDALIKEIRPSGPLESQGWPFMGRLRERGLASSQAYKFLCVAVAQGWLSQRDFQKAIDDATQS